MVNADVMKNAVDLGKQSAADYGKQKANEALEDQAKFQETLDKVSKDASFLKLKAKRDALSDKAKKQAYDGGKQDLLAIKWSLPKIYDSARLNGMEALAPGQTFTTFFRLAVQLWLFSRPKDVPAETMVQDMQSDFKYINTKLAAFEAIATVIPVLKPLAPVIQALRTYIKKFGAAGVENLANRQVHSGEQNPPLKEAATDATKLQTNIQTTEVKNNFPAPTPAQKN